MSPGGDTMRFGGNLCKKWSSPEEWAELNVNAGYTGVYFPMDSTAKTGDIDAYATAAKQHDLVICEIGIWNNLLDPDAAKRKANFERAVHQLELAEYVGANCCVNIAGSYNAVCWDGCHKDNFTQKAFDEIAEISQRIIDAVKPQRTYYTLEPMPNMYPDTADSYLELMKAVDRKRFGAHVDIVNIISSPRAYYGNTAVINEWFDKLGPYIRCCHAKDSIIRDELTVHLDECRPGTGNIDYDTYLKRVDALENKDVCLMLEHMTEEEDYRLATEFIKGKAEKLGIKL